MRVKTLLTETDYELFVGEAPIQDDLERCNCRQAGMMGHTHCGWNHRANKPMFMSTKESLFIELQSHCGAREYQGKWKYEFETMFPMDAVMANIEEIRKYAAVKKYDGFNNYGYALTKARGIEGEFVVARAEFTIVAEDDWAAKEKFDKIVDILVKADKLDLYSKHCIEMGHVVILEDVSTFKFI